MEFSFKTNFKLMKITALLTQISEPQILQIAIAIQVESVTKLTYSDFVRDVLV